MDKKFARSPSQTWRRITWGRMSIGNTNTPGWHQEAKKGLSCTITRCWYPRVPSLRMFLSNRTSWSMRKKSPTLFKSSWWWLLSSSEILSYATIRVKSALLTLLKCRRSHQFLFLQTTVISTPCTSMSCLKQSFLGLTAKKSPFLSF